MDRSERIGLGVSAAGHVLLLAALSLGLLHWARDKPSPPPTMEVSLTDAVALESRATSHAEPPETQAPEIGQTEPDAAPPPPQTQAEPQPAPPPKPVIAPEPKKAQPVQPPKKPEPAKQQTPAKTEVAKPAPEKPKKARAQRLGDDFLKGLDTPSPARKPVPPGAGTAPLSPMAARALNAEITRQIKPYWKAPTGADAEKLVTIIAVDLQPDGSLAGQPRVLSQSGVTASNAGQKQVHAENALRAVRLAAPFRLPPDLYDSWRSLEINFDKRLSQ